MGIDIGAKLIYGVPYSDLPEETLEEVDEMLDDGTLEYASPYYDASRDEWIVGVGIACYGHEPEDIENLMGNIKLQELPQSMRLLDLRVYVTPHVS